MTFDFRVSIERKPGLSDPEGTTTRKALTDLGFDGVHSVAFGRIIAISVEAADEASARDEVAAMCDKLLANPVMETYTIEPAT
ncbi:MAG: phosphoribosylformylglycinamidine synthase subunit PurS [Acidimicrobiia bacterium]|nr:phosphoribosylformylglycinamidine synthase subunit PurS [Acidimicrobiia bacterium]